MRTRTYIFIIAVLLCGIEFAGCVRRDAQTLYEQGRQLRAEGKHQEAMQCFIDATHVRTDDRRLTGKVYSNIANMCRQARENELAYEVYWLSQRAFTEAKDSLAVAYALNNRAWECAQMMKTERMRILTDSALIMSRDETVLRRTYEPKASAAMKAEAYDSVLQYTTTMTAMGDTTMFPLILRAQALAKMQHSDEAVALAQYVLEKTDNLFYMDNAYEVLIDCAGDMPSEEWHALVAQRTEVQYAIEQRHGDLSKAVMLYTQQKDSSVSTVVLVVTGILVLLLAAIGAGFGYRQYVRKHKPPTELQVREQTLERELEALRTSENMRGELHWGEYRKMTAICDERLMSIATKLKERGLTQREIRICIPVLIGLTYVEMADLLCRAESGIGKDKYLIASKLGVSVKGLQQYLKEMALAY